MRTEGETFTYVGREREGWWCERRSLLARFAPYSII